MQMYSDRQAAGLQHARQPIRRILLLKLDHIGDMLIAAPALMLLRQSFADAHITLLCAPWNVALAQRLGIADEIVPISFFSQNSLEDEDRGAVEARRTALVRHLQGLALAPFDLAIDLRRDEDTRELLKLFAARILAGFGDLAVFSYLDVALPFTRHGPAAGVTRLRLGPAELNGTMDHAVSARGLHLVSQRAELDLIVETDTLWSPAETGIADSRMLGVALYRIDVRPHGDAARGGEIQLGRSGMTFGAGWLEWENWGRWSNAARADITLRFAAVRDTIDLQVRVQGHTSAAHPAALVRLSAGRDAAAPAVAAANAASAPSSAPTSASASASASAAASGAPAGAEHRFTTGEEAATLTLTCQPKLLRPYVRSEPFLLRGGRYGGVLRLDVADAAAWQPLTLTILGAQLGHVLARLDLPARIDRSGALDFPFELEIKDSAEPILIQIEAEHPDHDRRIAITALELDWLQGGFPPMPLTAMETQLLDLAAMVALRHAAAPQLATAAEIAARLTRHRAGSSAAAAVARLAAHKRPRWSIARRRRIIGIGIGANKETKLWPLAHFTDLCRRLLGETSFDLAFFGGPQEAEPVATLIAALGTPDRLLDLSACCRIEDLGEVLAALDGFIGLDTGTTHFAGRIGLPTLSIFGAAHDPREWGPVGAASGWVAADIPCASCFASTARQCGIGIACMSGLTADAVWPIVEQRILAPVARPAAGGATR